MKQHDDATIIRLTGTYLLIFLVVIIALSTAAYVLIAANYRHLLGPAPATPEAGRYLRHALRTLLTSIAVVDLGLLLFVGVASYALARAAVRPLINARRREERFTADVAHELRTPLSLIASIAQAARNEEDRACAHAPALETITLQALEAGKIVSDLLVLARREEPHMLMREPTDLAVLVSSVVKEWERQASSEGVTIRSDVRSAIIEGDQTHLRRLLQNMLENALRYARSGIEVTVSAEGRFAILCIEDDGPGVGAEIRRSVFERFVKGAESSGSGLGLSICRWAAQAHGGDMHLAGGSRFIVRLPLMRA